MSLKNNYYCDKCKYRCDNKKDFNKHESSKKHQSDQTLFRYECTLCLKSYKYQSGLSKHNINCKKKNIIEILSKSKNDSKGEINNNEDFRDALTELKNDNMELKKMIMELKQPILTTINNNEIINNEITNNNTFNINVFLNDKCNKAINLDDFMKNICYEFGDFKKMLEDYVEGSMSILKKNMNQIPLHKRPMHYLEGEDKNQQVFHIRQNDIWKTETEINWLKQINADDDDVLEKQTLYFALKQLDNDKLAYLRYKYSANHEYMKHHKRLNCEITRVDKKMKLYDEVISMITLSDVTCGEQINYVAPS
jgi:hypothetical protein